MHLKSHLPNKASFSGHLSKSNICFRYIFKFPCCSVSVTESTSGYEAIGDARKRWRSREAHTTRHGNISQESHTGPIYSSLKQN